LSTRSGALIFMRQANTNRPKVVELSSAKGNFNTQQDVLAAVNDAHGRSSRFI
jgi:hypothetical protein